MAKVVIIGGGVAGLSAAHELGERGFSVEVYECTDYLGGKARSLTKLGSGTDGRRDLPGEHGFRFFPGFYQHVTDTMARTPCDDGRTVLEQLADAEKCTLAQVRRAPYTFPTSLPNFHEGISSVISAIRSWIESVADLSDLGLGKRETAFFAAKMIDFLTTCDARRLAELEKLSWWNYTRADSMSEQYRKLLAAGLTRSLVAMKAETANTRTVASILVQMAQGMLLPAGNMDRVLNGPTEDIWIKPWVKYLKSRDVKFFMEHRATSIEFCNGVVKGVRLKKADDKANGQEIMAEGDFYICAVPVEIAFELISPAMLKSAPSLANLEKLQVSWMNGIQFFLKRNAPLVRGHVICADSPWALTCISQPQFWSGIDLSSYGNGTVQGIISVDISDWMAPGCYKTSKPAQHCSADEIKNESWAQLVAHFSGGDDPDLILHDDDLETWFLDPDILIPPESQEAASTKLVLSEARGLKSVRQLAMAVRALRSSGIDKNVEPLLINTVGSWDFRPEARTEINNFFVAGDYVRTFTDLATMEGANEAGRRAVNAILDRGGSTKPPCTIFPLEEPTVFKPAKAADEVLFRLGLPHLGLSSLFGLGVGCR